MSHHLSLFSVPETNYYFRLVNIGSDVDAAPTYLHFFLFWHRALSPGSVGALI
jgi:hypothetical protein